MKQDIMLVYQSDESNLKLVNDLWKDEYYALMDIGVPVSTMRNDGFMSFLYRGEFNTIHSHYISDNRYINNYETVLSYQNMSYYYNIIKDLTIETFFSKKLDHQIITKLNKRGWEKAFIKRDCRSLEHIKRGNSIWPLRSLVEIKRDYENNNIIGKYAIRKFIEKDIIDLEERYWVLNGNIYHRTNIIPDVVKEAAKRLNTMGSKYYTIDATPEFVVEVNPGESSDRHAVNSAELFASWIKKEFVDGK